MDHSQIARNAAEWALSKVGCAYSQSKRTQEKIFDCSSLVARAYSAQGKRWRYGGSIPRSDQEVYDDDFELLWPDNYKDIGKTFGGTPEISRAKQSGDLQFLCTDAKTDRANKITHVAMVASESSLVHARGTAYGVCINSITLYRGKVCALTRYNPACTLRQGMKGNRTATLQKKMNQLGSKLIVDGEYGTATADAVKTYQVSQGLVPSGQADQATLKLLELLESDIAAVQQFYEDTSDSSGHRTIRITGDTVNVRSGPGTSYPSIKIARRNEIYEIIDIDQWQPVLLNGEVRWISKKYTETIDKQKEVIP